METYEKCLVALAIFVSIVAKKHENYSKFTIGIFPCKCLICTSKSVLRVISSTQCANSTSPTHGVLKAKQTSH